MTENQMIMRRAKEQLSGQWGNAALATLIYMALLSVASFTYVAEYLLYGSLTFGYCVYLIALTGYKKSDLESLFSGFHRFGDTLVAGLLITLATSVGMILLIVPGIIVSLGFSMTFFIMIDNPEKTAITAMGDSWNLMNGHKWELFCLYCRFIGWLLLCCLTLGILTLWINPYMTAAQLNFYRKIRYGTY